MGGREWWEGGAVGRGRRVVQGEGWEGGTGRRGGKDAQEGEVGGRPGGSGRRLL